jgi:hypothetical protein
MMIFSPIPMIRSNDYQGDYFNISLPSVVQQNQKATVLMAYSAFVQDLNPRPQTYLIPFFPKDWRFIGIPFSKRKFVTDQTLIKYIKNTITQNTQPIFLLTAEPDMPELYRMANSLGLLPAGSCSEIKSDRQAVTHLAVLLCPVAHVDKVNF